MINPIVVEIDPTKKYLVAVKVDPGHSRDSIELLVQGLGLELTRLGCHSENISIVVTLADVTVEEQ